MEACCVLTRAYREKNDIPSFFKYAMKAVTFEGDGCAEVCYEIGCYYLSVSDPQEASIWLSAALSAPCILQLEVHKRAESALQKCQGKLSE